MTDNNITHDDSRKKTTSLYFGELEEFRKLLKVEGSSYKMQIFNHEKKRVDYYRVFFSCLSAIFLLLSIYIGFKMIQAGSNLPFGRIQWSNFVFLFISLSCAAGAGFIVYSMKPEIEVMRRLFSIIKERLKRSYTEKSMELAAIEMNTFDKERLKMKLKHAYQDAQEQIDHIKEETQFLLKKINLVPFMHEKLKNKLFNQTLLEFRIKSEHLVETFETGTLCLKLA